MPNDAHSGHVYLRNDPALGELFSLPTDQCEISDPLILNLLVAKEITSLSTLDLGAYVRQVNRWAAELKECLPGAEAEFHCTPEAWKNDIHFFRLGMLCWYVDEVLRIRYREDQRDLKSVCYTDPRDLFLNGVIDTRRGTCGNMAALHVALGWRLGWKVSLALAGWHVFCRYDDGERIHNIEATKNGQGGFHSHPDEYYQKRHGIPDGAIEQGSDLRALRGRELVGLFVGMRARFYQDSGDWQAGERDYALAVELFPKSWLFQRKHAELRRIVPSRSRSRPVGSLIAHEAH
jgi:hypothetical protein